MGWTITTHSSSVNAAGGGPRARLGPPSGRQPPAGDAQATPWAVVAALGGHRVREEAGEPAKVGDEGRATFGIGARLEQGHAHRVVGLGRAFRRGTATPRQTMPSDVSSSSTA